MPESTFFDQILNQPIASRLRRNHGLEHATLHILSQRYPGKNMAGHSTPGGFRIAGEIPPEAVESAIQEALRRMKAGEHKLAIHPNCGTNFVTAGVLAGMAGALAMFGAGRRLRDKLERLPLAASLATLALIVALPLGLQLQERVTTSGQLGTLEVVKIISRQHGSLMVHRVVTQG